MSEEIKEVVENKEKKTDTENKETEKVDAQEEKTVTVAELQRRLSKKDEEAEERIKKAVEEALKKEKMTAKEKKEYEDLEKENKYKKIEADNIKLQTEIQKRDMRDNAIKTLSEKNIPVSDKVLSFVVRETAEDTLKAIDDMAELLNIQKQEQAKTQDPMAGGGGVASSTKSIFEIFDNAGKTD